MTQNLIQTKISKYFSKIPPKSSADKVNKVVEPSKPKKSFEVEEILGYSMIDDNVFFEVKWKNYASSDNTLEPLENIKDCKLFDALMEKQILERSLEIEAHYKQIMNYNLEVLVIAREGTKKILKQLENFNFKDLKQSLLLSLMLNGGSAKFNHVSDNILLI